MWTTLQIVFVALTVLLVLGGKQLDSPILFDAGVACLGLAAITIGWQAIITRRLVIRRRRKWPRESYAGTPAIFQGIQFNFIGLFLIGIAFLMYFDNDQGIFLQMVRRPGVPLIFFGGLCVSQAMIFLWGSQEAKQDSGEFTILVSLIARLFPGLIWLALGVGLIVLGLFDILVPVRFDEMGGRLLEALYGLQ